MLNCSLCLSSWAAADSALTANFKSDVSSKVMCLQGKFANAETSKVIAQLALRLSCQIIKRVNHQSI